MGKALPEGANSLSVDLTAQSEIEKQPSSIAEAQIAVICLANGASLATRNVKHFEFSGVLLVNPCI
jgi:toxin FitB